MEWLLCLVLVALAGASGYVVVTGTGRVPGDKVGVVYQRFGRRDRRFRVSPGGGAGPRATVLVANAIYVRPKFLFQVKNGARTYVPPGTIGVVVAKDGARLALDQTLCLHVVCDWFQDGRAFLLGGGQQGRQPSVLQGGTYYDINPELFEVLTVNTIGPGRHDLGKDDLREIVVPVGETGVVIAQAGLAATETEGAVAPPVPGHQSFQLPWEFLNRGGQRGAQIETLSQGGVYRINPWFARVVLIPTRVLILEWRKIAKPAGNFDVALDQIRINVEGHWLRFDMSQTLRIPAKAAPRLVARFGELYSEPFLRVGRTQRSPMQRFVERVLGRTVEGYFQTAAGRYEVLEFISSHEQVRLELEDRVRQALEEWDVEAIRTTLNEFEPEGQELQRMQQEIALQRERRTVLEHERTAAVVQAEIDGIRSSASTLAETERRLINVKVLEAEMALLGGDTIRARMLLAEIKEMNVPTMIGGDMGRMSDMLPTVLAADIVQKVVPQGDLPAPIPPGRTTERAADSGDEEEKR